MLLRLDIALDVIGPEYGLFHFDTGQGDEGSAEGHHRIGCFFVVEYHSMCRQVNASRLLSLELCPVLVVKVYGDIVAE